MINSKMQIPPAGSEPSPASPYSKIVRFRGWIYRKRLLASQLADRVLLAIQLYWMQRVSRRENHPPAFFIDVGAAGGISRKWRFAERLGLVRIGGFEPDPVACAALLKQYPDTQFLPYALANEDAVKQLHITHDPTCSSCLLPNKAVVDAYPVGKAFEVVSTIDIDARAFSSLLEAGVVGQPDFLKIDVQGFEYEVLLGFAHSLDRIIGIELESHTKPLYIGQKTMLEMVSFLDEHGFQLRRFEQQGPFEGECIEGNLFFSKRPAGLSSEQHQRLLLWEAISHVPDAAVFHFPG